MDTVEIKAHAKLNLTLDIIGKRDDGYHDLQMVMQAVELHDTVRVARRDCGIECSIDCAALPSGEGNIAHKAARCFFGATGIDGGVSIDIEKRIPFAAGMAGGSTDAAAVLHAMRSLFAPMMDDAALLEIGAKVGSDVPFCILGGTALAEGRGERLTPLAPMPRAPIVLCKPDFPISTPELFSLVRQGKITRRPDTAAMIDALSRADADAVGAHLCNVFEDILPEKYAEVHAIREQLLALGAAGALMTGSGPTVFGIFDDEDTAHHAAETLQKRYPQTFLTYPV
ncbi:MAG: 4-(cytidine 5'-diphospho)-2-C-methyl-D-erythritol kinase [Oscillospiraceae bacterium]|nr:4-(cytidine 5'-diphospho)-2-C-methyl-D-erythritol kinase [Oscillospiraceae bacterium]